MKAQIFGLGMSTPNTRVITSKLLTNFYCEIRPEGEKSRIVGLGFPGLDLFVDVGATPWRGLLDETDSDLLYGVHRAVLKEVNNAGVVTDRGMLNTVAGAVGMASNGTQVMIVDGVNGYIYDTVTTVFAQITDINFPPNPTSVTFQDGYFIVGFATGRFYISALYDGLNWDALDFTTVNSTPGPLTRIFADHDELIAFQADATSFYGNTGAADFPFERIQGASAEWGLAAPQSVVKFDDSVAFLCKNRMGEVIVGKLSGHSLQKLSTPDMDKIINRYAVNSDAVAFSYLLGGHPMYQINFPSAGESWNYDGLTGFWSKRKSQGLSRQICERGVPYLSRIVMSDYDNGRLYRLNPDALTENGNPIEGEIIGEHWDDELAFISIDRIRLDIEVGNSETATPGPDGPLGQQPEGATVMLSISRDDGKTWGTEMWKTVGLLGEYTRICEWRRLGTCRRFTAKFRITDTFRRVVTGCYVNPRS